MDFRYILSIKLQFFICFKYNGVGCIICYIFLFGEECEVVYLFCMYLLDIEIDLGFIV